MKKLGDIFATGIKYMFVDFGISYYAYFSVVVSELIYIWKFVPENALLFTILLGLSCISICVCGWLKGVYICTRVEFIITRVYQWMFLALCIVGCIGDIFQSLILFLLPIAISFMCIIVRNFQTMRFAESTSFILVLLSFIFKNPIVWLISVVLLGFSPMAIFFYVLYLTVASKILVVIICFAYAMAMPFIAYFEGEYLRSNVFENGYTVVWTKSLDDMIEKYNVSDEVFYAEEFIYVAYKFQAISIETPEEAEKQFFEDVQELQIMIDKRKQENQE